MITDAMMSRYHDRIPEINVLCKYTPYFVTYVTPCMDKFYNLINIFKGRGFFYKLLEIRSQLSEVL